jgi:DNA-binding transcriptional MerR regulator
MMQTFTISQVARRAGVGVATVRFYERQGLIAATARGPSGYRQYAEETVCRLGFIRRAKALGFSLVGCALSTGVARLASRGVRCYGAHQ